MTLEQLKAADFETAKKFISDFLQKHNEVCQVAQLAVASRESSTDSLHRYSMTRPDVWEALFPKTKTVVIGRLRCGCVVACDQDDTPRAHDEYRKRGYTPESIEREAGMKLFLETPYPCNH